MGVPSMVCAVMLPMTVGVGAVVVCHGMRACRLQWFTSLRVCLGLTAREDVPRAVFVLFSLTFGQMGQDGINGVAWLARVEGSALGFGVNGSLR
jgi:hypothetical protein